ncbi:Major allergen Mal d 1 [Linum perenne]
MGVITSETEISTRVPATRLFKTFVVDGDTIIPKIAPHAFKSFEILHGNGGPGTIKKIQFGEGGLQFFYQLCFLTNISFLHYFHCFGISY